MPALPFLRDLLTVPDHHRRCRPAVAAAEESNEQEQTQPDYFPAAATAMIPSSPSPPPMSSYALRTEELRYVEPSLIEIVSSVPGAKSTLLLSYLVTCLLQDRLGRPKQIVLYFDSAWKVPIRQIYALLLERSGGDGMVATEALSRLHVIRPDSSGELLKQLRGVEEYLWSLPDQDCVVAAIVLADLSMWYWSERLEEGGYGRESVHVMMVEVVRRLQSRFRCVLVVSGLGVVDGRGGSVVRSGLAGPWVRSVDVRLLLARNADGRAQVNVDATKWVQLCGGDSGSSHGKGTFEMYAEGEAVKITQFKHDT